MSRVYSGIGVNRAAILMMLASAFGGACDPMPEPRDEAPRPPRAPHRRHQGAKECARRLKRMKP